MDTKNYKFFQHTKCEYFPCHEVSNKESFNCLFCFCPLNALKDCGGNYKILSNGVKDCSKCLVPHSKNGYEHIMSKIGEVYKLFADQKVEE